MVATALTCVHVFLDGEGSLLWYQELLRAKRTDICRKSASGDGVKLNGAQASLQGRIDYEQAVIVTLPLNFRSGFDGEPTKQPIPVAIAIGHGKSRCDPASAVLTAVGVMNRQVLVSNWKHKARSLRGRSVTNA